MLPDAEIEALIQSKNRTSLYEQRTLVLPYIGRILGLGIVSMTIVNDSPRIYLIRLRSGETFRLDADELCDLDLLRRQLSKYVALGRLESTTPIRLRQLLFAVFCASNSPKGDRAMAGGDDARVDSETVFNCVSCHNPIPLSAFMQTKSCPRCGKKVALSRPTNAVSNLEGGVSKE